MFKNFSHQVIQVIGLIIASSAVNSAEGIVAPTPEFLSESLRGIEVGQNAFQSPDVLPTFFEVTASLGLVLVLIYLLYWALRRWQTKSGLNGYDQQGLIKILEKNYIDNRRGVAVVDIGGTIYYLGLGEDVTLLGQVSDQEEAEKIRGQAPNPGGFAAFPQQMERVADYLRRNQVEKSRDTLQGEAEAMKGRAGRIKNRNRKGDNE